MTSTLSLLLFGEKPPEVANRDKGIGENIKIKIKTRTKPESSLGRGCRHMAQHEREQRELQAPCQAALLAVWQPGTGLLPGRELPWKAANVCSPQQWGREAAARGRGGLQRKGKRKREFFHQAWALRAKASRARKSDTGMRVEQEALSLPSAAIPTCRDPHTLSGTQTVFPISQLKATGLPGLEGPALG